ncbi:hypothetical protein A2671_00530 [Candidatus Kaiserbacteria bacterium RIFCSPHIGHO2_01_FULL_49_13]|uniref:Uncharacterized protein n=1 Tax=Candidatus Kaiserbacteria bacterium RIFCSPHIGHO2_01_FULL_49_13 TaxID=1798477 RepID=A0A1F6CCV4_9BACT|nr:MAG: hypothetical protein A2671_00530 [Candidatus Kaiserbacteria bacterium RIFCSPHIGHO2_01_FULL_49_13]
MKKQAITKLFIGIVAILLIAGGWYVFKYRSCIKQINYVPPREQSMTGGGLSGLKPITDKGDYYRFDFREFRTSNEALRACIWK